MLIAHKGSDSSESPNGGVENILIESSTVGVAWRVANSIWWQSLCSMVDFLRWPSGSSFFIDLQYGFHTYEYILIYNFGCKSENNIITGQVTLNILFVRTEKCLRSNMYIAFTLLRKGFAELSCDYLVLISFSYPMVITLSCFNNFIMECYLQWFWFHIDWSTTCILDH
jgi:hypothetical protein